MSYKTSGYLKAQIHKSISEELENRRISFAINSLQQTVKSNLNDKSNSKIIKILEEDYGVTPMTISKTLNQKQNTESISEQLNTITGVDFKELELKVITKHKKELLMEKLGKSTESTGFVYSYIYALSEFLLDTKLGDTFIPIIMEDMNVERKEWLIPEDKQPICNSRDHSLPISEHFIESLIKTYSGVLSEPHQYYAYIMSGDMYSKIDFDPNNNYLAMLAVQSPDIYKEMMFDDIVNHPSLMMVTAYAHRNYHASKGSKINDKEINTFQNLCAHHELILRSIIHSSDFTKAYLTVNNFDKEDVDSISSSDIVSINAFLLLKLLGKETSSDSPVLDVPSSMIRSLPESKPHSGHFKLEANLLEFFLQFTYKSGKSAEIRYMEEYLTDKYSFDESELSYPFYTVNLSDLDDMLYYAISENIKSMGKGPVFVDTDQYLKMEITPMTEQFHTFLSVGETVRHVKRKNDIIYENIKNNKTQVSVVPFGAKALSLYFGYGEYSFYDYVKHYSRDNIPVNPLPENINFNRYKEDTEYQNEVKKEIAVRLRNNNTDGRTIDFKKLIGYSISPMMGEKEIEDKGIFDEADKLVQLEIMKQDLVAKLGTPERVEESIKQHYIDTMGSSPYTFKGVKDVLKISEMFFEVR